MDALSGLLDGPRARGAFLLRAVFDPPWAVRVADQAPLTVLCGVRGTAWVLTSGGAEQFGEGDVAVVRGPGAYTVADDPVTAPRVLVGPGGCSTGPAGEDLCAPLDLGVRSWGTRPDGACMMLIGTYLRHGAVTRPLLRALPPVLVLRGGEPGGGDTGPLVRLLAAEIGRDVPGQESVLDRLLDVLLVSVLRGWFAGLPGDEAPAWYRAHSDPVVGRALHVLHEHPAHPWTVAALAAASGASRAALARRFPALVGEPPMAYLTGLRLSLAADLLREPDATVETVARKVGYGSAFALSAAFKRERGISPRAHRDREETVPSPSPSFSPSPDGGPAGGGTTRP